MSDLFAKSVKLGEMFGIQYDLIVEQNLLAETDLRNSLQKLVKELRAGGLERYGALNQIFENVEVYTKKEKKITEYLLEVSKVRKAKLPKV